MTPDISIGRIMTLAEAEQYFTRVIEAEKALGPLTRDERLAILKTVGKDITAEELQELVKEKKILRVTDKGDVNAA